MKGGEDRDIDVCDCDCAFGSGGDVTSEVEVFVSSPSRDTSNSSCISSTFKPLLSKKAIFLSVDASFTSSSSKNFLACSSIVARLDDSVAGSRGSLDFFSSLSSCHTGAPEFLDALLESLILLRVVW